MGEGLLSRHEDGGLFLAGNWDTWAGDVRALPVPEIFAHSAPTASQAATSTSFTTPPKKGKKSKGASPSSTPEPAAADPVAAEQIPQEEVPAPQDAASSTA